MRTSLYMVLLVERVCWTLLGFGSCQAAADTDMGPMHVLDPECKAP